MLKKILVVDDEVDMLKVIVFRLEKSGYEVLTAVNGRQALDVIEAQKPDIVLLDLRLPIIGGEEVCLRLKNSAELKDIPIILITASADKIAERAEACQADDFLIKPFDAETLLEKIKAFVG